MAPPRYSTNDLIPLSLLLWQQSSWLWPCECLGPQSYYSIQLLTSPLKWSCPIVAVHEWQLHESIYDVITVPFHVAFYIPFHIPFHFTFHSTLHSIPHSAFYILAIWERLERTGYARVNLFSFFGLCADGQPPCQWLHPRSLLPWWCGELDLPDTAVCVCDFMDPTACLPEGGAWGP